MVSHPITPSTESDLRLQLAKQTQRKTGLLDILLNYATQCTANNQELIKEGFENILIDGLYEDKCPKLVD
ncbi:MAG: hypothetical protein R2822_23330 [Spirosomataceae bacterium]